jgi:hypothetical protein
MGLFSIFRQRASSKGSGVFAAADAPVSTSRSTKREAREDEENDPAAGVCQSMKNGTVPARDRNPIPQEYQQYIPFEKQSPSRARLPQRAPRLASGATF